MVSVVNTVAVDRSVTAVHSCMPAIVGMEAARAWLAGTVEKAVAFVRPVSSKAEPA